jgi:hypothetical protein
MNTNNHAPQGEVDILERMVNRHLTLPHEFICITESDLPGWWCKIRLFGDDSRKRNLWLDLDVIVTGSLDGLVTPLTKGIRIAKNWAQSGWGGCQSSVMYWEGDSGKVINDEFDPGIAHWPPINAPGVLWGDQEWITQLRDEKRLMVEYFNPADVVSYKYHCRGVGLPDDAKVVVFHGKPDPSEVSDKWVMDARDTNQ